MKKFLLLLVLLSGILLSCSRESSNEVYLVIATDGRFGVTEHAGIPAGDSLVEIRAREAACSCEALGIHPPIIITFGPDADTGHQDHRMVGTITCHKSQYSEEQMDTWIAVEEADTSNALFFRKFKRHTKIQDHL